MDDILNHVDEGVLTVNSEWRVTDTNSTANHLLGREEAPLVGADIRDEFPQAVDSPFQETASEAGATEEETTFEEYFPELERWLDVRIRPREDGSTIYLQDVTEYRRLQREAENRKNQLESLARNTDIIQTILQSVSGATTRREIEAVVCERLATTECYSFAWIGERVAATEQLAVRTTAGNHADMVELICEHSDDADGGLEHAAITAGEPQNVQQLTTESAIPGAVRREAVSRGIHSALAVPLTFGNTDYGALGVYATRQNAFGPREQTSFETLGRLSGFAINAARQRTLLLSDTVVELTVRVTDGDAFLVSASDRLGCRIVVEGIVPLREQSLLYYVRLDGATAAQFRDVVADHAGIDVDRVVHDLGTECLFAVTVSDSTPVLTLADRGASIRFAEFEDGTGQIVAEVSPGQNIQELVDVVTESFPNTELLSKVERTRTVETAGEFQRELHDLLTDRQRAVLRAAYLADYFRTPRGSTAEEIADTLDIASPTLHRHLRAAERKLLDVFFEDDKSETHRLDRK